ncbi:MULTISPECIES: MarR family winged helix-turn-helix transcriptional regulator [unclassified Frankia]|uniref:MarR family winged helix-turn-helix transcriptional regulator n=1 Tax=unclassified Frankia TaxID=2632575 RepID=UPI002AD5281D|nr:MULTISPECIES: winged helix DNA-binding protein [unclassified Frankia]
MTTVTGITAVLSELRRRGLVTRSVDATDRRKVAVAITDAGHHVLRDSEQAVFDALLHALTRSFTDSELAHLHASVPLLSRLADVL